VDRMETVAELRASIDETDRRLLELLCQRGRLVQRIQQVRASKARVPEREAEILGRLAGENRGPYPAETLHQIWNALFEAASGL
jgi:chorismate mutase